MPTSFQSICVATPVAVINGANITRCSLQREETRKKTSKAEWIRCGKHSGKIQKNKKINNLWNVFYNIHTKNRTLCILKAQQNK